MKLPNVNYALVVVKWSLALVVVALFLGAAYLIHQRTVTQLAGEAAKAPRTIAPGRIKLGAALAKQHIKVAEAKDVEWVPRVPVYGRVVSNPGATSEIRAAFAGRLRGGDGGKWPAIASHVKAGDLLGQLEVRGPQDRLDLESKLTEAKHNIEGAKKVLSIVQDRVKRFESVSSSFARGDYDAALVAAAEAETKLAASEAAAKLWHDAVTALDRGGDLKHITWTVPVTAPADGEITELVGRPDMFIESGGLVAKVVDFRKALVRVDVPLSLLTSPPPKSLRLQVLPPIPPGLSGPTNRPEPPEYESGTAAELIGAAGQIDPSLQATGYLYKVDEAVTAHPHLRGKGGGDSGDAPANPWRPGLFVKAHLDVNAAKPIAAFAVPKSALLFHQGRALVYRQLGKSPGVYQRVEVAVLGRDDNRWIVNGDLVEGDLVVIEGALLLLSEEFRADVDD
jgi:multidrug efflux pump subunit AcrA (membrane-fusion protein)